MKRIKRPASSVKYKTGAHPTIYNKRQYRSRLEAKWAAFFDRVGWRHEYEPIDLGEWSPDFALYNTKGNIAALVEVKPISVIAEDVCQKMERGVAGSELEGTELLLLGLSPAVADGRVQPWNGSVLGWLAEYTGIPSEEEYWWCNACLGEPEHGTNHHGTVDFAHEFGAFYGRIFGHGYKEHDGADASWVRRLWSEASNKVQWQKR